MAMQSVVKSAPPPPYSSGNGSPNRPELAHGQHDVDREGVVAVPRLGVRRDLGLGEVAHDLAERLLLVGQVELHRGRTVRLPPCALECLCPPLAVVGGRLATDLVDVTRDLAALDCAGSGRSCCPSTGEPVCARFATRPAGAALAGPRRGRARRPSAWTIEPRPTAPSRRASTRIRAAIAAGDVYQVNLTRRLSAPLPAGRRRRRARRARWPSGNPAPYTRRRPPARARRARRVGVARAVPAPRRPPRRVVADQGHGRDADGVPAQGPGRERDDRRPRPQRPRPGVRVGLGARAVAAARSRTTPASSTWCPRSRASCAPASAGRSCSPPRSRPARSPARRSSPPSSTSRGSSPSTRGLVLRRHRLGRRRPPAGRAQRRHPHVLVRGRRSSTSAPAAASPGTRRRTASGRRPS